jgi:hypothetical protein
VFGCPNPDMAVLLGATMVASDSIDAEESHG